MYCIIHKFILRNCQGIFQSAGDMTFPPAMNMSIYFPTILASDVVIVFDFSHAKRNLVVPHFFNLYPNDISCYLCTFLGEGLFTPAQGDTGPISWIFRS